MKQKKLGDSLRFHGLMNLFLPFICYCVAAFIALLGMVIMGFPDTFGWGLTAVAMSPLLAAPISDVWGIVRGARYLKKVDNAGLCLGFSIAGTIFTIIMYVGMPYVASIG